MVQTLFVSKTEGFFSSGMNDVIFKTISHLITFIKFHV